MAYPKGLFERLQDYNRITFGRFTPLQKAILKEQPAKVRKLLRKGADPNDAGVLGADYRPLALAIGQRHESIARALLKAGANPNEYIEDESYLCKALSAGALSLAHLLIIYKADPHIRNLWTEETALFNVRQPICEDALRMLVTNNNLDINAVDKDGYTAFYKAVTDGHFLKAQILLSYGADADITPPGRPKAFSIALEGMNDKYQRSLNWNLIQQMVLSGCQTDRTDAKGRNLLHHAINLEDMGVIRTAIHKTSNCLGRDRNHNTALHFALETHNPAVVSAVLSIYKELPTEKNKEGYSVMDAMVNNNIYRYAREQETFHIIESLFKKGGQPDTKDKSGRGLIHYAVERSNTALLSLLSQYDANIDLRDSNGQYALQIAVRNRNLDMVDFLLDAGADPNIPDDRGWTLLDNLSKGDDRTSPIVQRLIAGGGEYIKQLPASEHIHQYKPQPKPESRNKIQKIDSVKPPRNDNHDDTAPRPIPFPKRRK